MIIKNLLFIIHTADHEPAHVEVYFGTPENYEAWAKVNIEKVSIIESENFSTKDLDMILRIVQGRQKFLSSQWRKIHGKD